MIEGQQQRNQLAERYLDLLKKSLTASLYDESAWLVVKPKRIKFRGAAGLVKKLAMRGLADALQAQSITLLKQVAPAAEIQDEGRDWPFIGYTMIGHRRLDNVQFCAEDVIRNNIAGDFVETGVWRGGTVILMRAILQAYGIEDRKVWAADSFQGLPVPKSPSDGHDLSDTEYLKVSLDQVKRNFVRFGLLDDQVEFLEGWFADTLPKAPIKAIALLRLDGDLYSSTMDALQSLYSKVTKGGYVIVDDYYSWPSCQKAVTDFLQAQALSPEIKRIDWTGAYWQV